VQLVSVERDPARAAVAAEVFAAAPQVRVVCGDWTELYGQGPFDLLVLDGGGQGKGDGEPADPVRLLAPGGAVVVDDFTPASGWPPLHDGQPDTARLHWLEHPALRAVEVRLAPDLASVVGRLRDIGQQESPKESQKEGQRESGIAEGPAAPEKGPAGP
jgi:hypothetical protein